MYIVNLSVGIFSKLTYPQNIVLNTSQEHCTDGEMLLHGDLPPNRISVYPS